MSAGTGPLQRLSKLLYIFFLRVLYWISSGKPLQELDDEARIDLPVNVVYRERLRTWMTTHFRKADSSQSLRQSEEWAQKKADFIRSPSLRKKYVKSGRRKGLRVRFSDVILEYPRTSSEKCSQASSLPPTIRIEDWSTPPSPEVSYLESLTAADIPLPRSTFMLSSSRDSLTVPSSDSPGFKRNCGTLGNRRIHGLSYSGRETEPDYEAGNHDEMCRSNLPQFLERYSESDGFILPRLIRPVRTSKKSLSPILGKSNKTASVFKRHHFYPLLTTSTSPSQNSTNSVVPLSGEIGKDDSSGKDDYHRHSFDGADFPFPMGIVLSSDVQVARFHEKGLATTSGWGFQCQMHPFGDFHQQFTPSDSGVPYPCVFDFDDYLQNSSQSPVPAAPVSLDSASQVSSCSIGPTSSTIPIKNLSPADAVVSTHALSSTYTHRSYRNMRLLSDGKIDSPETTNYERKFPIWSSGTDEEQEHLTGIESSESSSTEDLPLSNLLSYRSRHQGQFDEAAKESGKPVNSDNSSVLEKTITTKDGLCDLEWIHPSSRSHMLKQRQYVLMYGSLGKDKSRVSLAENYGSGATLWHHPRQETAQSLSSRHDGKLDPIIEMSSESECSSGLMTRKAVVLPRFGSDISNIVIADRTPPPSLHGASDSPNMVNRGRGSRLEVTRKTVLAPGQNDDKNESVLRTQKKNVSVWTLAEKCTKARMKPVGMRSLSPAPLRPKRSAVPQRY